MPSKKKPTPAPAGAARLRKLGLRGMLVPLAPDVYEAIARAAVHHAPRLTANEWAARVLAAAARKQLEEANVAWPVIDGQSGA